MFASKHHQVLIDIKVKDIVLLIIVMDNPNGASSVSKHKGSGLESYIDQKHLKQLAYYTLFYMC